MLLDTHALIWWLLDDRRLSQRARREIRSADEVLVSTTSGWEIATKHRVGKLDLRPWNPSDLPSLLERARIEILSVSMPHAIQAGMLPGRHTGGWTRADAGRDDPPAVPSGDHQLAHVMRAHARPSRSTISSTSASLTSRLGPIRTTCP